jgi:hypothetical protein
MRISKEINLTYKPQSRLPPHAPNIYSPSLPSGGEVTVLLLYIHVVIVQGIGENYCCFNYPIFVCYLGDDGG